MKITAAELHRYQLPLRKAWVTAAGSFSQRSGCLLRITTDNGLFGYGDCAPLTGIDRETLEGAENTLRIYAAKLIGRPLSNALKALPSTLGFCAPTARCTLETALLDLLAQSDNLSLTRYLRGSDVSSQLRLNAALGSLMLASEQAILAACGQGFSVLKLKVGTSALDQELDRLHYISNLLPQGVQLRLDANRAWCETDAARFLKACADLPVEMIEEPLADPKIDALQRLQTSCAFPLALDESLPGFDLDTLCSTRPIARLILKPPRFGGLLAALDFAKHATAAGLQCIVTSSIDSACGVLAAGHLAAAIDNGLAHGLATSCWLATDTGTPPGIAHGRITLPDRPGLGFIPHANLTFTNA